MDFITESKVIVAMCDVAIVALVVVCVLDTLHLFGVI